MEANLCHLSILSKCYKRAYGEFLANDANVENHSLVTVHAFEYHVFGWLLFLALCVHALCRLKVNNLIADILKEKPSLASECKDENLENFGADDVTYFKGLMKESHLQFSLNILEKDYDYAIHNFELDERLFIDEEDCLLASGSFVEGCDTIKPQISCFNPKDKVCLGDVCWGCSRKQEWISVGKKPPVSTSNSHLEGKVKLRGWGNDGIGATYRQGSEERK